MPRELRPGVFTALFADVGDAALENTRAALDEAADELVRAAKAEVVRGGSHQYGTRTPARPGGPPARISGTLQRSIGRLPVTGSAANGLGVKVGPGAGFFPPYGGRSRTPASKYGMYLETGRFPWLRPASRRVTPRIPAIFVRAFQGDWPHYG